MPRLMAAATVSQLRTLRPRMASLRPLASCECLPPAAAHHHQNLFEHVCRQQLLCMLAMFGCCASLPTRRSIGGKVVNITAFSS